MHLWLRTLSMLNDLIVVVSAATRGEASFRLKREREREREGETVRPRHEPMNQRKME